MGLLLIVTTVYCNTVHLFEYSWTLSGVPKCLNYYEIFIVYTQFTNVVSGRILQLGGPHARIRDLWCRNNSTKKIVYSEFQDLHFSPNITSSWDSAVWLDVAGILVWFPAGSLLQSVQTGCGANPASYPVGTGNSFAREKWLRCRVTIHTHLARRLTLRRLMSYIYGAPILDVSRSHTTTQHSR